MAKNNNSSRKLRLLNKIATTFREYGLVEAIDRKYYRSEVSCEKKFGSSTDRNSDGRMLRSMATIFLFYFFGIFLGTMVLCVEKIRRNEEI